MRGGRACEGGRGGEEAGTLSTGHSHEKLRGLDVLVTNQSDKDVHLPKIQSLDERIKVVFGSVQADAAVQTDAAVQATRATVERARAEAQKVKDKAAAAVRKGAANETGLGDGPKGRSAGYRTARGNASASLLPILAAHL